VVDFMRRSALCLLAVFLAVGCDKLQQIGARPNDPGKTGEPTEGESASAEQQASIQVYFSQVWEKPDRNRQNPNSIAKACAHALSTARRTLDVCCHEIDNKVIVEAIVQAHLRGVKVRVITETDYLSDLGPTAFSEAGIPVISDNRSALMHQKFAVMDGVAVWTGSFNFTENCAYKNNNNGIYIKSPKVAENYAAWFEWFWADGKEPHAKRRGVGPTPNPSVQLRDGTVVETCLTSFDKMEELPIEIIRGAKKSVKFLAFSFTHEKIADEMRKAARRNIPVAGVFEERNLKVSVYSQLADEPNVTVVGDGNPFNMHHKVIIVDDAIVLAGSFNFTKSACGSNDENYVVISRNLGVAKQFVEEFNRVYQAAAQKVASKGSKTTR